MLNPPALFKAMCAAVAAAVAFGVPPATAQTVIKIAHTNNQQPTTNAASAMSVAFKSTVEADTRGAMTVNIFPASQLGKERELMEAVKLGTIQAMIISEGTTVNFYQPFEALGIPYLFPSLEAAWKVYDGPFGQTLYEEFRKANGVRIIASAPPGGFRNFGTNKPIKSVADLKGLRIRTMEHPVHQAMVTSLGASPTPVAFGEVYSAMKSGVVDGLELPYTQILNMKLNEVVKYVIADAHLFNQEMLFVNDKWFNGLPPEQQKAVLHAGRDAQTAGRGVALVSDAIGPAQLREAGMIVYYPTDKEREQFKWRRSHR
ncbi:MAG: TRAP transporter substrate-binding protein DctP [Casimicrobiaceae bacterium]